MARQLVVESLLLRSTAAAPGLLLGTGRCVGHDAPPWQDRRAPSTVAIADGRLRDRRLSLLVGLAVGVIPLAHRAAHVTAILRDVVHGEGRTEARGRGAGLA